MLPRRLHAPGKAANVVPPYSFLAVSSILASRAIRWITVALLIALEAPTCTEESYSSTMLPPVKGYLTLPTVSELVLNSIPLVVILGLLAELVSRLPGLRSGAGSGIVARQAFYAAGFQAFIVLLAISLVAAASTYGLEIGLTEGAIYALLAAFVVWPAVTFAAAIVRPGESGSSRARTVAMNGLKVAASIVFSTVTALLFVAITFPLSRQDVAGARPPRPILYFEVLSQNAESSGVTVSALIANTAYTRRLLRADRVRMILRRDSTRSFCYDGSWTTWNNSAAPVLPLDSGEVGWARGYFTPILRMDEQCRGLSYNTDARMGIVDLLSPDSSAYLVALWRPRDSTATLAERMRFP